MKTTYIIALLTILTISLALGHVVLAQSAQSNYTVNLTYLTVQLTYPSQVNPGDAVTVNIQAIPKSSDSSASLTAQIYYTTGADLHQLISATLINNYVSSGSSFSKQVQFTIPQDAPRTSLVTMLTEKVQVAYASHYYYPAYYNYSSPYCYYDPNWGYDCQYTYTYYNNYGYDNMNYPSYSYETMSDSGVAPLSYIKATTPEYTTLQTQYQALQSQTQGLQSQNQALQQQLAQSQAQDKQLNQDLQNSQNTNAQKDATIASLTQQLSASQRTNTTWEDIAAGVGVLAIVFAVSPLVDEAERASLNCKLKRNQVNETVTSISLSPFLLPDPKVDFSSQSQRT